MLFAALDSSGVVVTRRVISVKAVGLRMSGVGEGRGGVRELTRAR